MKSTAINKAATITLSSDFGAGSHFTGVMHGVIMRLAPMANIIDLCHTIRPHDTQQAARLITNNFRYFPPGSIHIIVVDPEVGSYRRIILLKTGSHLFIAPDNGILSPLASTDAESIIWDINRPDLYLSPLSKTFHGRDIFAPIAAHLARGNDPETLGIQLDPQELTQLHIPSPQLDYERQEIQISVLDIDHFGNIITNLNREEACELFPDLNIIVDIKGQQIRGIATCYNDAQKGRNIALFNSENLLEIAMNQGRASDFFQINTDTEITISAG